MALQVASAVAALLLGQAPEVVKPAPADEQAEPAPAPPRDEAIVDELRGLQAQQQAGNEQLEVIAQGTQATKEEVSALRQDQAQARAQQALLAQQLAAVVTLLREADALLVIGSFDADAPLAQAEALLSQMRGADAASARARVTGGRLSLAQRNFVYARDDVFWAVAIANNALR